MSIPYAEVIGDPIGHSKSPLIHRFWLEKLGMDGDYRAVLVPPEGLASFLESRRPDPDWRGCNVTIPHKQSVMPLLDSIGPLAEQVGAVNTVFRIDGGLGGGNTDVKGILDAVPTFAPGTLRTACLIGSGGAALAAMAAFRLIGVQRVFLNVRNPAKGESLIERFGVEGSVGAVDDARHLGEAQLIVNASSLGMTGQDPMPEGVIEAIAAKQDSASVVFDMVYAPLETELLKAARAAGLNAIDGLTMLVGQAAAAFETFYDVPAPRQFDPELRSKLTS